MLDVAHPPPQMLLTADSVITSSTARRKNVCIVRTTNQEITTMGAEIRLKRRSREAVTRSLADLISSSLLPRSLFRAFFVPVCCYLICLIQSGSNYSRLHPCFPSSNKVSLKLAPLPFSVQRAASGCSHRGGTGWGCFWLIKRFIGDRSR